MLTTLEEIQIQFLIWPPLTKWFDYVKSPYCKQYEAYQPKYW